MKRLLGGIWPRSLQGQLLLAVALALLLAQGISAVLLHRAQTERREAGLVHIAALRLFAASREESMVRLNPDPHTSYPSITRLDTERAGSSPIRPGDTRIERAESDLRDILNGQGVALGQVVVFLRPVSDDPRLADKVLRRAAVLGTRAKMPPSDMIVAAIETRPAGEWIIAKIPYRTVDHPPLGPLIGQTLLLFGLLFGAIAVILRRITRPLEALTGRLERFAQTRDAQGQLEPEGPEDMRRLIVAHNGMEARLAALLDEKDVMLGAIGHDLKTPLTALRVRIESVEDEAERAKMARTIEDITRSLDDILSLARVGRPSDPLESADLGALVAQVAEEFEDMGEPVTYESAGRIVLPLRATWLRRAVRNLVVNALRYGQVARISVNREGDHAVIRIEDDGPGIAEDQIARMLEPFTRGEPSRNSETGGAGLGLTLARAIADQHGGSLQLTNRRDAAGAVTGLIAALSLPLT